MNKWLKNYWYHYKFRTVFCLFLVALVGFSVWEFTTSEDYDYKVYLYLSKSVTSEVEHSIELALEKYGDDIDGNGEVNVQIVNFSYDAVNTGSELAMSYAASLSGEISECENFLFITDDYRFEELNTSDTYSNLYGKYDFFTENDNKTYPLKNTKFLKDIKDCFKKMKLSPSKVPDMCLAMRTKPEKNIDNYQCDLKLLKNIIKKGK